MKKFFIIIKALTEAILRCASTNLFGPSSGQILKCSLEVPNMRVIARFLGVTTIVFNKMEINFLPNNFAIFNVNSEGHK